VDKPSLLHRRWMRLIGHVAVSFSLLCASFGARADIALQWQNTEMDEREQLLAEFLTESNVMTDLIALLQMNFAFDPSLTIKIGTADGPLFDEETKTIHFSYSYISDVLEAQMQLLDGEDTAVSRSLDVVEYTLYHLAAHALVNIASEEHDNQVERIASWLMMRGFPNGAEQLVTNARAFGMVSQKHDGTLEDYWHAHALFAGRQRDMECWALGYDRQTVEPLLPAVLEPLQRVKRCEKAWQELDQQVRELLSEQLKDRAPLING